MSVFDTWSQPRYLGNKMIFNGSVLTCHGRLQAEPLLGGPQILRMGDQSAVIQLAYKSPSFSEVGVFWRFEFEQQADQQAEWDLVDNAVALGRAFYLIPFRVEIEGFRAVAGVNEFKLRRPIASSIYSSFDTASYPIEADLNGVAQTVIDTGTPGVGEIKVTDDDVETPTLSFNDELVVRYYPAYAVVAIPERDELRAYGDFRRNVVLWETNKQVPA